MNILVGVLIGVVATLFCVFCYSYITESAKISDAEIEAWLDWRQEWKRRQAVEEKMREMGAVEMPMAGENVKRRHQGGAQVGKE